MSNRLKLGFGICGSFCTHGQMLRVMEQLAEKYDLYPVLSEISSSTDTRFGSKESLKKRIQELTGRDIITSIKDAEPLGPGTRLDAMLICPCTGNTLAKIAQGITDTAVTMAAKAHLRADRPLLIALASNDSLSANLSNISALLLRKQVFFVPMRQDDPAKKPHSLVADFTSVSDALSAALEGRQMRPLFL